MTTDTTSPAGRGAPAPLADADGRRPQRGRRSIRPSWLRWPRSVTGRRGPKDHPGYWAVGVVVVVLGGVLVVSNVRGHSEIRASQVTLTATAHRLEGVRAELAHAHRDLAAAERRGAAAGRSFDLAQAALSSTQATLAQDDASIYYQGIDLGQLNGCLSLVEQALNQLAVGQTAGGLASLRASSPSCSVLEAGHTP